MSSFARRVLTRPPLALHRALLGLLLSGLPVAGPAVQQAPSREVDVQIEKDVWIPLFAASAGFDAEGFLEVQSKDLVRVALDSREIYGFERYATEIATAGRWRILADKDTAAGGAITEADFRSAAPMWASGR